MVGVFRQGEDQAAEPADARAGAGARRRGCADRQPSDPRPISKAWFSPERSLYPAAEPDRHRALKVAGLATGLADKGVSLFYEQQLHKEVSPLWVERCRAQISRRAFDARGRPGRAATAATGSATVSATPTSRSPAPSATRPRPCLMLSPCRTIPISAPIASGWKPCRCSGRSASRSSHRREHPPPCAGQRPRLPLMFFRYIICEV